MGGEDTCSSTLGSSESVEASKSKQSQAVQQVTDGVKVVGSLHSGAIVL